MNMENLEIEYKVMVDSIDFFYLQEKLKDYRPETFIQENIYYDTVFEQISRNDLSLRVRHIKNKKKFIATLKEKVGDARKEYEYEVDGEDSFPKEIIDKLNEYGVDYECLVETSRLTTFRNEYKLENGVLCLDENHYYGNVDYEVECEASTLEKAKKIVKNLLDKNGISYQESKLSKVARANKYRN